MHCVKRKEKIKISDGSQCEGQGRTRVLSVHRVHARSIHHTGAHRLLLDASARVRHVRWELRAKGAAN